MHKNRRPSILKVATLLTLTLVASAFFLAAQNLSRVLVASAAAPSSTTSATCTPNGNGGCLEANPIVKDIQMAVNFLSAGVGIVVVGAIILGGIQYAMAGDSPEAVGKAKQRITNALIALFVFMFMWAFLQWLIPGGIFG